MSSSSTEDVLGKSQVEIAKGWKSAVWRYGLAIAAYVLVVGLQTLLLYFSIKISFTIPIVVSLFAVSWYGGRRPGLLLAILFEVTTIYSNPVPPDTTLTQWTVSYASNFALIIFIVLMVSGRKTVEGRIRESGKRYELLFENNPFPMWIYDLESLRFLAVNNTARLSYGYSRNEFLKMTIKDIRPEKDIPAVLDEIANANETISGPTLLTHRKKDGSLIEVEITSDVTVFD